MSAVVFNTTLNPRLGKRERLTVPVGAVNLTATAYTLADTRDANHDTFGDRKPKAAVITVEAQPIRWTIDGTAPVATSLGHTAVATDVIFLDSLQKIVNFRAIRDGAIDSVLEVTYLYGN